MKKNKVYIVLIAVVIIFLLVMFLLFGFDELKKESYDTTIVVGDDTLWVYNNKSWSRVSKFDQFNWKKFDVYTNNEKIGNYYLWYSNKWYVFDDNKEAVLTDGDLLGVSANYDISVYNHSISEIDDYSYVYSVLEDNDLPTSSKFTSNYKVVLDIDNDGIEEEFYVISNAFPMDFNPTKIFSIVFMVKDEKIYPIYTNISNNSGFNGCKPYFSSFIDVDEDSKYEVILSCAKYSTSSVSRILYKFNNKEFKILISNNK